MTLLSVPTGIDSGYQTRVATVDNNRAALPLPGAIGDDQSATSLMPPPSVRKRLRIAEFRIIMLDVVLVVPISTLIRSCRVVTMKYPVSNVILRCERRT